MRRSELLRWLARLEPFPAPDPALEQVTTPPEAAAAMVEAARARDDLDGRAVLDLGTGTGTLAIAAALEGAEPVLGVEVDPAALSVARRNAEALGLTIDFRLGSVADWTDRVDTILMNPPFGAQRRHADRPFWETAFRTARRGVYAFALADSRSFIAKRAVARPARIEETRPVAWELPAVFRHHRRPRRPLAVDLWVIRWADEP